MFGIMFEVSLLVASLKISTFMNKPLFIHTSEKLKLMRLHMPSLIQKHAHVKGQRSNHHIFIFQPNPSWAKKRPNRYTSFHVKTPYDKLTKIYTNYFGYMAKVATKPIYGKNLLFFFLQNQKGSDHQTWYVALEM